MADLKLEYTTCPLCGQNSSMRVASGTDMEYHTSGQTFFFIKCGHCEVLYLNPRPAAEEMPKIYPKTYYTQNPESPVCSDVKVDKIRELLDGNRCKALLPLLQPDDAILDIGCGEGRMLRIFKKISKKRLSLVGIDADARDQLIEKMRGQDITIIKSYLEDIDLSGLGNIKIVIMNELLEHLRDPFNCLKKLSENLKPGALLAIETPDMNSISRKIFPKRYWAGYHFPRHLQIYSEKSLRCLLEENGFEIIKYCNILAPVYWIVSFRNILGLNSYEKSRSIFEFLNFKNMLILGIFTVLDQLLKCFGFHTACQRVVAVKK